MLKKINFCYFSSSCLSFRQTVNNCTIKIANDWMQTHKIPPPINSYFKFIRGGVIFSHNFLFLNGPNPASFCLSPFFSHNKYSTITINEKSFNDVLGTRTQGNRNPLSYGGTPACFLLFEPKKRQI